jgi:hypothetical protein
MKKYEKPMAEFVSLAAAEQIATSAEYYDDVSGPGADIGTSSAPGGWW